MTLAPAVTPAVTVPGTIGGLTATPGNGQVTLKWTAAADNGGSPITNYEIQYANGTGTTWSGYKAVTRPASTATTATITGLTNGNAHLFIVRAVNAKGAGQWVTLAPAVTPAV